MEDPIGDYDGESYQDAYDLDLSTSVSTAIRAGRGKSTQQAPPPPPQAVRPTLPRPPPSRSAGKSFAPFRPAGSAAAHPGTSTRAGPSREAIDLCVSDDDNKEDEDAVEIVGELTPEEAWPHKCIRALKQCRDKVSIAPSLLGFWHQLIRFQYSAAQNVRLEEVLDDNVLDLLGCVTVSGG